MIEYRVKGRSQVHGSPAGALLTSLSYTGSLTIADGATETVPFDVADAGSDADLPGIAILAGASPWLTASVAISGTGTTGAVRMKVLGDADSIVEDVLPAGPGGIEGTLSADRDALPAEGDRIVTVTVTNSTGADITLTGAAPRVFLQSR